MAKRETLAKINTDLQSGRKQRAITRLRSLVAAYPYDLSLRNQLAEIYYDAGFMDMAGLYWLLHQPTDKRMKKAIAVYQVSVNHSAQQMLRDLAFHGDKNELEAYALNQLNQLEALKAKLNNASALEKQSNPKRSSIAETLIENSLGWIFLVCILIFLWGLIDIATLILPW